MKKTVKFGGGSLMLWGCITLRGFGRLIRVNGIMDACQYVRILSKGLFLTLRDHGFEVKDVYFQQDHDPKHTSHRTTDYLARKNVDVLPWPGQAADMNIIEPAWKELKHRIGRREHLPTNLDELWVAAQEEWEKLGMEYLDALYGSMTERVSALKDANGGYTKY
jgi:hypothetical protein